MRTRGVGIGLALALLVAGCMTVSAQTALALEPGVHADPGSPAAKEYALPLSQARDTGSSSGSTSEGTLFGAGIKPPGSGGHGHTRAGSGAGARHSSASTGTSGEAQGSTDPPAEQVLGRLALRSADGGGNGSTLALIGGGVAILVLGGFGGTVLRHSRRPTS